MSTRRFSVFSFMNNAVAARRQRTALSHLDDHALDDLGLTRRDADLEAGRPFWDLPRTWIC